MSNAMPSEESINSCVEYLQSLIQNSLNYSKNNSNLVNNNSEPGEVLGRSLPQSEVGYVPFEMDHDIAAIEEVIASSLPSPITTIWDVGTNSLSNCLNKSNDDNQHSEESFPFPRKSLNGADICISDGHESDNFSEISSGIINHLPRNLNTETRIIPFYKVKEHPFHLFNIHHLHESTKYTHYFKASKRSAAYYGVNSYAYGDTYHEAKPFSDNQYLQKILSYVEIVVPGVDYNSALIHRYENGKSHIPHHSDNEIEIEEGSEIVTISLGESRFIEFQDVRTGSKLSELLHHGDVFIMNTASQTYFTHSIPVDTNDYLQPRMSITLRKIKPRFASKDVPSLVPEEPCLPSVANVTIGPLIHSPVASPVNAEVPCSSQPHEKTNSENKGTSGIGNQHQCDLAWVHPSRRVLKSPTRSTSLTTKPKTLYVSSSMFRHLDPSRLQSDQQEAIKFFYPGADAQRMLNKLQNDKEFLELDRESVTKVFLLTGCNNVDSIYFGNQGSSIKQASHDLSNIIQYFKTQFSSAVINVISILPRKAKGRNDIINLLNTKLYDICFQSTNLSFIDLFENNMFVHRDGTQRKEFFMPSRSNRYDDVHLNALGVVRLAKHLKFIAHNH